MVRLEFPSDPAGWAALGWIPPGWCECGCGRRTSVPRCDYRRWGHVKGIPVKFARGHRLGQRGYPDDRWIPNPSGLCRCECGGRTPIAQRNNRRLGHRKGEHVLYLSGHNPGVRATATGVLYFIGTEDGPIKVGWTVGLTRRLREFQVANWRDLVVHGSIVGGGALERQAHAALKAHRIRGEWFEREAALRLLDELQDS